MNWRNYIKVDTRSLKTSPGKYNFTVCSVKILTSSFHGSLQFFVYPGTAQVFKKAKCASFWADQKCVKISDRYGSTFTRTRVKIWTVQVFFTVCAVKSWSQGTRLRNMGAPQMTSTETNIHFKLHRDYSSASTLTFSVHSPLVVKLNFILILLPRFVKDVWIN